VESPVKERLTGALILIAALIVVVPEMLSGPDSSTPASGADAEAGPPVRTYQLQLDTPSAGRSEDQSALSPVQSGPAPAAEPPVATVSVAEQPATDQPAAEKPAAEKPAQASVDPLASGKPVAADSAAGGNWWAQLGSFSSRDNAERLARELRAAGYQISVSPSRTNGKELFRVRAGPVGSREAAVALQGRLAAIGHKAALVAP
jgi:DedD protein